MNQWYFNLVELESITIRLDKMKFSDAERLHLAHLLDSTLHHLILDAVLSHLNEQDKRVFLNHMVENNHDKIWKFLNEKVEDIEIKIKKTADQFKKEFVRDLEEAEKLS